jgi:hypothetical protein
MDFMARDFRCAVTWDNGRSNLFYEAVTSLEYKRRHPGYQREQTSLILSNFCVAILCPFVPLTAVQRFKGERCLWANTSCLRTCTRYRWLGFWEVHQAHPLAVTDRLLCLHPLLHPRPLHLATSTVWLHQLGMSFLFTFFSEVNLMICYLLFYQTCHELFINYNFLLLI